MSEFRSDIPWRHCSNAFRTTSAEKRELERLAQQDPEMTYQSIRQAGEVHRQVREYARRIIKPGMTMIEIADNIEEGTRALVEASGMDAGIGFPTGLSLNHCAAHYTPNGGDKTGGFLTASPFEPDHS
jgi:methionyl aminopeptidase